MSVPRLADVLLSLPLPYNSVPLYLKSWKPGVTPFSTWPSVITTICIYLATIFAIQVSVKQPKQLKTLFQIHNIFLSGLSGLLLVLMLEEVLPIVWKHGIFFAVCNAGAWTPRLEFYYLINYYCKYLELFDTVFLALKKKPLTFLHVFHHSATAVLCFVQFKGATSVAWVVITLNLAVHVVMYYYYYATAGGAKIWWKQYITTGQITQFVIDIFVVYFASYNHFAFKYTKLPVVGDCSGAEEAAWAGCVLITSYLLLFINFYRQTYKAKANKKTSNGTANGKPIAAANGHHGNTERIAGRI